MKILIAADGSVYTRAAARYVARHLATFSAPEVHIVHVHAPIPYPLAASRAGRKAVDDYQRESSLEALAPSERELAKAGIPYTSSYRVGDIATEVDNYVRANAIDLVVCGSHGLGVLANVALGSVATKLVAALNVPVLVVTREAAAVTGRQSRKAA
jgi:nucleotide-binding universal stress UspA family protein